jgi:hypothetical protein
LSLRFEETKISKLLELAKWAMITRIHNTTANLLIAYIKTNAPGCQKAYIGLYENNSTWAWVNGDNSTYKNWAPGNIIDFVGKSFDFIGNPTNDPSSSCALIDQNSGTWLNQDCNTPQCYICAISLN